VALEGAAALGALAGAVREAAGPADHGKKIIVIYFGCVRSLYWVC